MKRKEYFYCDMRCIPNFSIYTEKGSLTIVVIIKSRYGVQLICDALVVFPGLAELCLP